MIPSLLGSSTQKASDSDKQSLLIPKWVISPDWNFFLYSTSVSFCSFESQHGSPNFSRIISITIENSLYAKDLTKTRRRTMFASTITRLKRLTLLRLRCSINSIFLETNGSKSGAKSASSISITWREGASFNVVTDDMARRPESAPSSERIFGQTTCLETRLSLVMYSTSSGVPQARCNLVAPNEPK